MGDTSIKRYVHDILAFLQDQQNVKVKAFESNIARAIFLKLSEKIEGQTVLFLNDSKNSRTLNPAPNGVLKDIYHKYITQKNRKEMFDAIAKAVLKDIFDSASSIYNTFSLGNGLDVKNSTKYQNDMVYLGKYMSKKFAKRTPVYILIYGIQDFDKNTLIALQSLIYFLNKKNCKLQFVVQLTEFASLPVQSIEKFLSFSSDNSAKYELITTKNRLTADRAELMAEPDSSRRYLNKLTAIISRKFAITKELVSELIYVIAVSPVGLTTHDIQILCPAISIFQLHAVLNDLNRENIIKKEVILDSIEYTISPNFIFVSQNKQNADLEYVYLTEIFNELRKHFSLDYERMAVISEYLGKISLTVQYCFLAAYSKFSSLQNVSLFQLRQLLKKVSNVRTRKLFDSYCQAFNQFNSGHVDYALKMTQGVLNDLDVGIKDSENKNINSSDFPISVVAEVVYLQLIIQTRKQDPNRKKLKSILDKLLQRMDTQNLDLKLRLDEISLQLNSSLDPHECVKRFKRIQQQYLSEINEKSVWESRAWTIKYSVFLSHVNALDWSKTGEKKNLYLENAVFLIKKYKSTHLQVYSTILNNVAGDFMWRDHVYREKALNLIEGVTEINRKKVSFRVRSLYEYNEIIIKMANKKKLTSEDIHNLEVIFNSRELMETMPDRIIPKIMMAIIKIQDKDFLVAKNILVEILKNEKKLSDTECYLAKTNLLCLYIKQKSWLQAQKLANTISTAEDKNNKKHYDLAIEFLIERNKWLKKICQNKSQSLTNTSQKECQLPTGYSNTLYQRLELICNLEQWV